MADYLDNIDWNLLSGKLEELLFASNGFEHPTHHNGFPIEGFLGSTSQLYKLYANVKSSMTSTIVRKQRLI